MEFEHIFVSKVRMDLDLFLQLFLKVMFLYIFLVKYLKCDDELGHLLASQVDLTLCCAFI